MIDVTLTLQPDNNYILEDPKGRKAKVLTYGWSDSIPTSLYENANYWFCTFMGQLYVYSEGNKAFEKATNSNIELALQKV